MPDTGRITENAVELPANLRGLECTLTLTPEGAQAFGLPEKIFLYPSEAFTDGFARLRSENERLKGEVERVKDSQRWIPVSERLPGKMGHYIALYQRTDNHAPLLMIATFIGGEWSVERQHMPDKFERLTHWFPTPPLPEVKE